MTYEDAKAWQIVIGVLITILLIIVAELIDPSDPKKPVNKTSRPLKWGGGYF